MGKIEKHNDYTPEEDFALWELHEIRREMFESGKLVKELDHRGEIVGKRYQIPQATLTVMEPKKEYNH